ncbi:MAG: hypothetical protein ACOCP4_01035 [Candidatus Woesearchaeota archaeon]
MSDRDEINGYLNDVYDALESLSISITEFVDDDPDNTGEVILLRNGRDGDVIEIYDVCDGLIATIHIESLDDLIGVENSKIIKKDLDQGNAVNLKIKSELV